MAADRGVATHSLPRKDVWRRTAYTMLFATLAGALLMWQQIPGGELLPTLLVCVLFVREPQLSVFKLALCYLPVSIVVALSGDGQQLLQHLIPAWSACGITLWVLRRSKVTLMRLSGVMWLAPR